MITALLTKKLYNLHRNFAGFSLVHFANSCYNNRTRGFADAELYGKPPDVTRISHPAPGKGRQRRKDACPACLKARVPSLKLNGLGNGHCLLLRFVLT